MVNMSRFSKDVEDTYYKYRSLWLKSIDSHTDHYNNDIDGMRARFLRTLDDSFLEDLYQDTLNETPNWINAFIIAVRNEYMDRKLLG